MSLIDDIINVSIKKSTLGITSAGFDSLLIIGSSKKTHRVKSYGTIDEVLTDYGAETPEYKAATFAFGQTTKLSKILVGQILTADEDDYVKAYDAIAKENNDFYGVMLASREASPFTKTLALAAHIETQEKIFGIASADKKILDSDDATSILSKIKEAGYERSFCIYSKTTSNSIFPEAAWFGLMLSKDAGSATWAYKTLTGFASDKLTLEDIQTIEAKHGNYYTLLSSRNVVLDGKTASGEYLDVIAGLDWLTNQIKTQIANSLILNDKIPYTNPGIAVIESMLRNSLNTAADRDIIDKESIRVTIPDVRNISQADKQARKLPDVKFEARLSGAIHKVQIQGTVEL